MSKFYFSAWQGSSLYFWISSNLLWRRGQSAELILEGEGHAPWTPVFLALPLKQAVSSSDVQQGDPREKYFFFFLLFCSFSSLSLLSLPRGGREQPPPPCHDEAMVGGKSWLAFPRPMAAMCALASKNSLCTGVERAQSSPLYSIGTEWASQQTQVSLCTDLHRPPFTAGVCVEQRYDAAGGCVEQRYDIVDNWNSTAWIPAEVLSLWAG